MYVLRLVVGRVLASLFTLLLVSMIIFLAIEILPGDAATRILGRDATPETLATLREQLHLNDPALVRFGRWLAGIVQGDLGRALTSSRPIVEILAPKIFNTLMLSIFAFLIYLPLAVLPAMTQALRRDRPSDHAISIITLLLLSTPEFLLATLLLIAFVIELTKWIGFPLLPSSSIVDQSSTFVDYVRALAMPAVTLATVMAVYGVRMLRDNLIEVLDSDYIRMAELKGLSPRQVLWRHALPNAMIPFLNVTALNIGYLVGSVVVVEKVFAFPGFGSQLVDSLQLRDFPLFEATVLIAAAVYIVANLLADICAILLNPRLRRG